jgi:superfamily II DNA helicase RecQ
MSRNGAPVYTVCTNEQLAEITKRKPKSLTECMQIEGIGQGKADKYVPAFLECINAHVGYDAALTKTLNQ